MWLDFFREKGHDIIPSASLVPVDDPTLLWINAGVAPLKKYFDGREIPKNRRMVNSQKCIRTNDIENVGKTARHHTFFEMLGNFSIGDYFRDEALTWAIELLTSPRWFGFDINRLYFTVYPADVESVEKWISLGVPRDHIIALESNFWEIGEGPCGPCWKSSTIAAPNLTGRTRHRGDPPRYRHRPFRRDLEHRSVNITPIRQGPFRPENFEQEYRYGMD